MNEKPEHPKTDLSPLEKLSGVIRGAEVIAKLIVDTIGAEHVDSYLKEQATCLLASIETAKRLIGEIQADEIEPQQQGE